MARELTIANRRIADDTPCYVVAELGANHGGSVETARTMIRVMASAGVHAVKLQKRDVATLYTPAMLAQPYASVHAFGPTYGAHRAALELDERAYRACQLEAAGAGVTFFATAFDEASADLLMGLGVPAIKIHSGGLPDLALLNHVASLKVPVILSTGGGTPRTIDTAVNRITARHHALALLHCTAAYPVRDYAEVNLRCIDTLRRDYPDFVIGWSSHVSGIALPPVAYAMGARILEVHVTLDRTAKGTDHAFSLEPAGVRKLTRDLARTAIAVGDGLKRRYSSEEAPLQKMTRHWNWIRDKAPAIGTTEEVAISPYQIGTPDRVALATR